ncbi:MAG: hypothetical protein AB1898_28770 [Acidobacteriota bacterium]
MSRIRSPLRMLCVVEVGLGVMGMVIRYVLSLDLTDSVYHFQRVAIDLGLSLRAVYALIAVAVLFGPCFLMGTTVPLACEAGQRQFGLRESRRINSLYFFNTVGAVFGCLVGVALLLPTYGQGGALALAASLNVSAALILQMAPRRNRVQDFPANPDCTSFRISGFGLLAFGFGCWALWYEMFLYRAISLAHEPLPLVFSTVLAGYLLFWSLGAYVASLKRSGQNLKVGVLATILSQVAALYFWSNDVRTTQLATITDILMMIAQKGLYFVPCFCFGVLFGFTLKQTVSLWGRDVGWFHAWNTLGCCCGILLATFGGYEVGLLWMMLIQGLGLLSLAGVVEKMSRLRFKHDLSRLSRFGWSFWIRNVATVVFGLSALAAFGAAYRMGPQVDPNGAVTFSGKDGVISIDGARNLIWDGLWHSRLSADGDHVGTYNWALAVDPILAHPTGSIREALIVGLGSGITAGTLAKLESLESLDVYDINQTLKRVLARYPEGTLQVAENPKIRIRWQDGRSGLALSPEHYDLITQQPLYLKQAGSSILLSKEYFQLVSRRMAPNGVFNVYANGTAEQALAVRQTASEVFPHMLVLHGGCQLILSKVPLDFSRDRINLLLERSGELWNEIRLVRERLGPAGWQQYTKVWDLPLAGSCATIRDDFPIVEYPRQLTKILRKCGFMGELPSPRFP